MKLEQMTLRYEVQRSCNFQNAKVVAEVVCTMEPGDKMEAVFAAGMKRLAPLVDTEVDLAIKEICHAASSGG